jgi:hypothetical protein
MSRSRKNLFRDLFHREKESPNVKAQTNQVKIQDSTTNVPLPTSPSQSTQPTQPMVDLWKTAYDQLDDEKKKILSTSQTRTNWNNEGKQSQTEDLINKVIQETEEQYEKYQKETHKEFRESAKKIIDAALSFKNIISAVAAFDPTQHAASAWAIVSLGLTVCNAS